MPISNYSTTRDSNAAIAPGNIRSDDFKRDQQIINSIRQLMADLASLTAGGDTVTGLQFPATQVPSSDPNTLDDYERGTYTPVVSFATPGTSSFVYTSQVGRYVKIGDIVSVTFVLQFTPTIGTGAGLVQFSLPFTETSGGNNWNGPVNGLNSSFTWPANRTSMSTLVLSGASNAVLAAVGSALSPVNLTVANLTDGVSHITRSTVIYEAS